MELSPAQRLHWRAGTVVLLVSYFKILLCVYSPNMVLYKYVSTGMYTQAVF